MVPMLKKRLLIALSMCFLSVALGRLSYEGTLIATPSHCLCQESTGKSCSCRSQMCGITTFQPAGALGHDVATGKVGVLMANPNIGTTSMPSAPWASLSLQSTERQSLGNAITGLATSNSSVAHIDMTVDSNNQVQFNVDAHPDESKDTIANGAILKIRSGQGDSQLLVIPKGNAYSVLAGRAGGH
jgi:hypothetical protein